MRPDKILYVDDEPMALKYFERLVSPIAPVLTALSVEEGRAILLERGHEIAVLISDQRMPTAYGNELLRYARDNHPAMVRMLTTAYSELGEAIEAINTGEIYRYITKPWDLENLRADLRNALELSSLRSERDDRRCCARNWPCSSNSCWPAAPPSWPPCAPASCGPTTSVACTPFSVRPSLRVARHRASTGAPWTMRT